MLVSRALELNRASCVLLFLDGALSALVLFLFRSLFVLSSLLASSGATSSSQERLLLHSFLFRNFNGCCLNLGLGALVCNRVPFSSYPVCGGGNLAIFLEGNRFSDLAPIGGSLVPLSFSIIVLTSPCHRVAFEVVHVVIVFLGGSLGLSRGFFRVFLKKFFFLSPVVAVLVFVLDGIVLLQIVFKKLMEGFRLFYKS